jgi:hypothetical protein
LWFIDLGFNGPAYTWSNKRFSSIPTYECLDRCLANAEWCRLFPTSSVLHLPMMYSDHAPILLLSISNRQRPKKPFRFENWWLMEQDFQDVAQTSWNRSASHSFSHKTHFLAADLRKWRRLKPKTRDQLHSIEEQVLADQSLHPSQQIPSIQHHLHQQHQHLQEIYHIQRAKKRWAIKGDRNTDFFHLSIIKRNRKNTISFLTNPDGTHSTTPDQIAATLTSYFQTIFTSSIPLSLRSRAPSSPPANNDTPLPLPNQDLTDFTYCTPDFNELYSIIKNMRSNATPGPDGLNAAFYKATWNWSKQDVHQLVSDFYTNSTLPSELNSTFITLIPKKPNPVLPQDFRPIGLCNVIYKIISKSLADRIKPHLPSYISQSQSAFIAGRHISSNVILTQEIIHSFKLKSWTSQAFLLKIDLAKAFDHLEWSFISQALTRIGFNSHFINLIYTCISTPSLSILINQEPTPYFYPQRGLRQGCPLSPYLFVIAINELSLRLQDELNASNLQGVSLAPGAPPIHCLLLQMILSFVGLPLQMKLLPPKLSYTTFAENQVKPQT